MSETKFGSYLWATSRKRYVSKKHKSGCVFCRIAKRDKKTPKKEVYRNRNFMVVMNIFPYNRAHLEVVPMRHVYSITELSDTETLELFNLVKKTVKLIEAAYKPIGFNIGINIGEGGGASIDHLHVQIVPRYKRETGFMEIIADTRVMSESLDQTLAKLKKHISILKG